MNLRREAITSSDYWDFQPSERVMTIDGYPGVVELVEDGPIAGAENYVVTLDNGLGGGNYSASMLSKMPTARSAAGIHLATDDYPELGTVIEDRPDPGKMSFTAAALSQERMEADAEDHDEPGGDDQPHSCSYCGGTDFKDLTDNGRVRQATCATCNGTMSAHPGMQWTPELIGDPSNHPKATIDPRSGASPGAGAPGQAGINDFIDFNSRASTTAAKIPSATCPTCKGSGAVSWSDEDPDWDGDPEENPGKVHTAPCDDCGGKGVTPETSDEELAEARKRFEQRLTESTAKHVQEKHPAGKLVTIDDVRGCGPRCPVGREWDRQRKPFHYKGSLNRTLLKIAGVPTLPERVVSDATTAPEVDMKQAMQRLASQMAEALGPGSANRSEASLGATGARYQYRQTFMTPNGYEDQDHEIEGPLYHGGRANVGPGDHLTVGRKPNSWGDDGGKSTHNYFTTNRETAASYARDLGHRGRLYEVEPTGDFKMDHHEHDFKTPHPLRVVREVPREEWE